MKRSEKVFPCHGTLWGAVLLVATLPWMCAFAQDWTNEYHWWNTGPIPIYDPSYLAFGNGVYVAVSLSEIASSEDGIHYENRYVPLPEA